MVSNKNIVTNLVISQSRLVFILSSIKFFKVIEKHFLSKWPIGEFTEIFIAEITTFWPKKVLMQVVGTI